jgi:hypothetical protein
LQDYLKLEWDGDFTAQSKEFSILNCEGQIVKVLMELAIIQASMWKT